MTSRTTALLFLFAIFIGIIWGLTTPLVKIAVQDGRQPFGLIFWQSVIVLLLVSLFFLYQRRWPVMHRSALSLYSVIACIGTVIPNYFSFIAASVLPAGIMALIISLIPIFGYPLALLFRLEPYIVKRLFGLICGSIAMALIALPENSLPDRSMVWMLPVAMLAPFFYASEGIYLALKAELKLPVFDIMAGSTLISLALSSLFAAATQQFFMPSFPLSEQDWALTGSSVIHLAAYSGYIWMVARAGPVFSSQIGYVSTAAGVFWAILLLQETYSLWVWAAVMILFIGLALVTPRHQTAVSDSQA